ncbi:MAG: VWA domain-containing protein [Armatimonadota bacterium]|nr:VWA domain-containing protein [Armatimonadota bacterium]MCX7777478.1 VWA domain-containing protein [Armatimonadota bacterium]MDW8025513.1 VWA domain-containing protein [Armatimonadota bacterium]
MGSIKLSHKLSYSVVPSGGSTRLIYLLLRIDATDASSVQAPMALVAVIDKSESMMLPMVTEEQLEELRRRGIVRSTERDGVQVWEFRGFMLPPELRDAPRPFDFVKRSLRSAVEHLQDYDEFALIAFAAEAQVVLPMRSGKMRHEMIKALDSVERLQLGEETKMSKALEMAHEQLALRLGEPKLLRTIVISDGYALDESQCIDAGRRMADDGIRISTMGVGVNFNEELMVKLADISGGEAFFVPDPSHIPDVLNSELSHSRLIALRQANLKLRFAKGVEIRKAYKMRPAIAPVERIYASGGQEIELHIGDLQLGISEFLLELLVPPRRDGVYRIVQVWLSGTIDGWESNIANADVVLRYQSGVAPTQPDGEVMRVASLISATELQTRALHDLRVGDTVSATLKLNAAKTRLLSAGANTKHIDELLSEIERYGKASPHATKRMRYETRRLS